MKRKLIPFLVICTIMFAASCDPKPATEKTVVADSTQVKPDSVTVQKDSVILKKDSIPNK